MFVYMYLTVQIIQYIIPRYNNIIELILIISIKKITQLSLVNPIWL